MSETSDEKVDHFFSRLTQKPATSEFGNTGDAIRQKLIENAAIQSLDGSLLKGIMQHSRIYKTSLELTRR